MHNYYLEQAITHAYYIDNFGTGTQKDEAFKQRLEQIMWYMLFLAAEAGEI